MRRAKWLFVGGGVLIALAVVWSLVAVPVLVRFPTNLDMTIHYTGTFTNSVDPNTMQPLAQPVTSPLRIDRHIKVVKNTYSTVTVIEDVTTQIGTQPSNFQHMQFVMDRRTMRFVSSKDTVAFGESTGVANPAGTYRVNFPMNTKASGPYASWTNETGTAVVLTGGSARHFHKDAGLWVIDFRWSVQGPPQPAYMDWLKAQGNPTEVAPDKLLPILAAAQIDVPKAIQDVTPHLTPAESAQLQKILAQPVKLNYTYFSVGLVSVEPKTGSEVYAHADTEGIKVAPDLSSAAALQPLLTKYSYIPSVSALAAGLQKFAAQPPTLAAQYTYSQTPTSSAAVGAYTRNQMNKMNLATTRVPRGLGLAGLLLLVVGLGLVLARRRVAEPVPVPPAPVPVPAPVVLTTEAVAAPEPAHAPMADVDSGTVETHKEPVGSRLDR